MPGDSRRVFIGSIAPVVPPFAADQTFVADLIRTHFGAELTQRSRALIRATFSHHSIRKRHFAVDDPVAVMGETPDDRVARFTAKAVHLSSRAVELALTRIGIAADQVSALIVNTCTGYICPGLSTYLLERLGMRRDARVYDLVGSGCGGILPNLQLAEALVRANGGIVVSVAVEICSATFQMGNDLSLIMSNALFADGAAAAVVWDRHQGLELVASAGRYVPEQREEIRFVHRNGQLYNQLSLNIPQLVKDAAAGVVGDLLGSAGLTPEKVHHWALHTGGDKVIAAVAGGLGISEDSLRPTRTILAEYGNMSSPTVLFVLDHILENGVLPGQWCVMVAYGAGLSAHACLLRQGD